MFLVWFIIRLQVHGYLVTQNSEQSANKTKDTINAVCAARKNENRTFHKNKPPGMQELCTSTGKSSFPITCTVLCKGTRCFQVVIDNLLRTQRLNEQALMFVVVVVTTSIMVPIFAFSVQLIETRGRWPIQSARTRYCEKIVDFYLTDLIFRINFK